METKSRLLLDDLSGDILSIIFDKCTIDDILSLYHVCKRFQNIIGRSTLLRRSLDLLIVGHRNKNTIAFQRSINDLSYFERVKIFQNWCFGRYNEHILFNQPQFNPSRMHLEKEFLYKSFKGQLRVYRRLKNNEEVLCRKPFKSFGNVRDSDITCLQKDSNCICIGRRNGRIKIISLNDSDNDSIDEINVCSRPNTEQCVESVDFADDLLVTSTLQRTSVWQKKYELDIPYFDPLNELGNGYKCIKLSPNKTHLAMGKYKDTAIRRALHLVDLETNTVDQMASNSSSIYDLHWKDDKVILTGHYDTTFRLFDTRSNLDEHIWQDPYDLAVYSISYDGNFGVLCGMKYHCRVNLYDLRVPNKYIQLYFPKNRFHGSRNTSSPAYQVMNDQSQLFIITDSNLRILDFDADWAESKDYTNIFVHEMIETINS